MRILSLPGGGLVWLLVAANFGLQLSLRAASTSSDTASAAPTSADTNFAAVANSVVKIFSTVRYPDVYRPRTKRSPGDATGSGVVIESKRILFNAHVVEYATVEYILTRTATREPDSTALPRQSELEAAVLARAQAYPGRELKSRRHHDSRPRTS